MTCACSSGSSWRPPATPTSSRRRPTRARSARREPTPASPCSRCPRAPARWILRGRASRPCRSSRPTRPVRTITTRRRQRQHPDDPDPLRARQGLGLLRLLPRRLRRGNQCASSRARTTASSRRSPTTTRRSRTPAACTMSPENSDKLAQRNLQITPSGNPGYPVTHRIPRPSTRGRATHWSGRGDAARLPGRADDRLGQHAVGRALRRCSGPQVDSADVLALASSLYGAHPLTATDANTIACTVTDGVTYIPYRRVSARTSRACSQSTCRAASASAGVADHRATRRVGAERARGRRPSGRARSTRPPTISSADRKRMSNWRYVTGTFQVTIPVETDGMLLPEETTLAVLKWRLEHMAPASRWYPRARALHQLRVGACRGVWWQPGDGRPSLDGAPEPTPARTDRWRVPARQGLRGDLRLLR